MSTGAGLLGSSARALDGLSRFLSFPDWLAAVVDAGRVGSALARRVPEFASGRLVLYDCRARRLRLKRGRAGWSGQYEATVVGPDGERRAVPLQGRVIPPGFAEPDTPAAGVFGAADWRCYLPELRLELQTQPADTALPALPHLTDVARARALLERGIQACSPAYSDIRIQSCAIKALRYKPGSRCTVVYQLEYPADLLAGRAWPRVVVAKTYHGDKGQNAYDGMRALWASALSSGALVTIAEPLAYIPELRVLVQGPIPEERTLEDLIKSAVRSGTPRALAELRDYMRKTAAALAALHGCGVNYGELVAWEDELVELREILDRLAGVLPAMADAGVPLLARLEALVAASPPDAARPSHRAFRPAQVLLSQGKVGFIDFDGFGQAEPALDLSRFIRKTKALGLGVGADSSGAAEDQPLDRAAMLARLGQMEAICEVFLTEYERHIPVSRQRVALWETLDLLTLVLYCWTKIEPERLHANMFLLEHHLRASGQVAG